MSVKNLLHISFAFLIVTLLSFPTVRHRETQAEEQKIYAVSENKAPSIYFDTLKFKTQEIQTENLMPVPVPPTTTTTIAPHTHEPRRKAPVQTAQAPTPDSASVSESPNCGGWESEIAARWPAEQVGNACRIMMCESGGNPLADNPSSSASGLFQFLDSTWANRYGYSRAVHATPNLQLDGALSLWQSSGWRPWSCR